jgi:hypothetical protein
LIFFSDKITSTETTKRVKFNLSVGVSSDLLLVNEEKNVDELKKVIYMSTTGKDYRAHFSRRDEEAYRAFQQNKLNDVAI